MITALSGLIGFAGSLIPKILDTYQEKQDRKHELDVLAIQSKSSMDVRIQNKYADTQIRQMEARARELDAMAREREALYKQADNFTGSSYKWVDASRSLVRPVITYCFFFLFLFVEISILMGFLNSDMPLSDAVSVVWDDRVHSLFVICLTYWFGNRTITKLDKKRRP